MTSALFVGYTILPVSSALLRVGLVGGFIYNCDNETVRDYIFIG